MDLEFEGLRKGKVYIPTYLTIMGLLILSISSHSEINSVCQGLHKTDIFLFIAFFYFLKVCCLCIYFLFLVPYFAYLYLLSSCQMFAHEESTFITLIFPNVCFFTSFSPNIFYCIFSPLFFIISLFEQLCYSSPNFWSWKLSFFVFNIFCFPRNGL